MEGGGNKGDSRAALRRGMDVLLGDLKQAARNKAMRLVDAEGPVDTDPWAHLNSRDRWNLSGVDGRSVHLMVQTMEAWIVSDPSALSEYYGQGFGQGALPRARDLERVPKRDIENSLQRATERTRKGSYKKIAHASDLLGRIDAETVHERCRHCQRLFEALGQMIETA